MQAMGQEPTVIAAHAKNRYRELQVQASPGRLGVMLYDGALRFLYLALDDMQTGNMEAQGEHLGRAQRILLELLNTLNHAAGETSHRLDAVYRHCIQHLFLANVEDRRERVQEVIDILTPLRDGWEVAACDQAGMARAGSGRRG
jgi:flagellar protein FliS